MKRSVLAVFVLLGLTSLAMGADPFQKRIDDRKAAWEAKKEKERAEKEKEIEATAFELPTEPGKRPGMRTWDARLWVRRTNTKDEKKLMRLRGRLTTLYGYDPKNGKHHCTHVLIVDSKGKSYRVERFLLGGLYGNLEYIAEVERAFDPSPPAPK